MELTERYTEETKETPFDHTGGYTYAFTRWVMKVAEATQEEVDSLHDIAAGAAL